MAACLANTAADIEMPVSMPSALSLPSLLDRIADRPVMLFGATILIAGLVLTPFVSNYTVLLAVWLAIGLVYSIVPTPSGRLLRRSAHAQDRPALFAAHFALSHAAWLLTYPLAGWLGATIGLSSAAIILALVAGLGLIVAIWDWPALAKWSSNTATTIWQRMIPI